MELEQFKGSYLVEQYRSFFTEVLRIKADIEARSGQLPPEAYGLPGQEEEEERTIIGQFQLDPSKEAICAAANRIRQELIDRMRRVAHETGMRREEYEQKRFQEIFYIMAAAADEVFVNLSWVGRDFWSTHLLEEELFQSHNAGIRFFAALESLLRDRDASRVEVAAVYLIALSLGFRGRYRNIGDEERIEYYRLQLFAFLFHRDPGLPEGLCLLPQAYAYRIDQPPEQQFPRIRPWLYGIGAVLLAYIAVAHLVWEAEKEKVVLMIARAQDAQQNRGFVRVRREPPPAPVALAPPPPAPPAIAVAPPPPVPDEAPSVKKDPGGKVVGKKKIKKKKKVRKHKRHKKKHKKQKKHRRRHGSGGGFGNRDVELLR